MSSADAGSRTGAAPEVAGSNPREDAQQYETSGRDVVSVLCAFGKSLAALLPVYLAGYFGFSISLVLLALVVYTGWQNSREGKKTRLQDAVYVMENERDVTTRLFRSKRELPAWVNFPDVEKVEWMNQILQQVWPFMGQYVEKLLVKTITPSIRAASAHLQTLSFTKVDLGDTALRISGVKAYTEFDKRQVILDLHISYAGDVEIDVEVKKFFCKAGVKGIQLHGKLRVILEPLIGDVPLVGAVTMFFIRRPKLDINWTGLTNLLDIPGLNSVSDTMIMDVIASFLVLPNRLTVPLVSDLHVAQLRSPLPRGIVRIHLLEAENLAAKDNYIKGVLSGKSDPYAVLRVGTQIFTSHHVDNSLNPQWREMYEVIVHEVPGQELELEVFDKDPDQDDFLGRMKLDLGIVKRAVVLDEWFMLKDASSGEVHLRLECLSLLPSAERLTEVLQRNQNIMVTSKTTNRPSAAVLTVYLDRAQDLPFKKGHKEPSPMVQVSVQQITKESKMVHGTINPVWEDAFTFLIQDPRKHDINIQVKDDDRSVTLGSLSIPLSCLLSSPELSMDQWFQLENSGPASRIYITALLRVLWLDEEAISSTSVSAAPGERDVESEESFSKAKVAPDIKRPEKTSPDSSFGSEGVLRIHLVEAQNLIAKDNLMGGIVKGKSDPYVKIRVGGMTFKSRVIKENLNPVWNELYEVILTQLLGQEVNFDLYDKDIDQDDFLGRVKMNLQDLISSQFTDQWYKLNDVKSGRLHLVMEWLPKVSDPSRLEQILQYDSLQSYQNKAVLSAGLLFVYMERAHGLSLKKNGKEPKAGAELSLRNVSHRTKVGGHSTSPQWDETFHFLIQNPREDILTVKLSDSWSQPLGVLVLPILELLDEKDLLLDRWFSLDGAVPESQILLRAELKLLDSKVGQCSDDTANEEEVSHMIPSVEADAPANRELRHRNVPAHGNEDAGKAQVKFSIMYSSAENRLLISIHACRNLPCVSKDPPDSYVSFILLPDKNRNTKKKTSVRKRTQNPEFNERFDFDMSLQEANQRRLELSVKNSVSFMSREKELIGKLQIDLKQLDLKTGVTQWCDLSSEIS